MPGIGVYIDVYWGRPSPERVSTGFENQCSASVGRWVY